MPLETFTVPEKRFPHINIDIVGPLPESCDQRYLITIIDRNTWWPQAIRIPNITTVECVEALVGGWISRFGIPEDISSDRGSQFTSALWTEIAKRLGVKVHRTTAFHHQTNEMAERFHRSLKAALKARLTGNNWVEELPWVLLGLKTASKEDLGCSLAEIVYGEPFTIFGTSARWENIPCGHGRSRRTDLNRPPQTGASGSNQTSPAATTSSAWTSSSVAGAALCNWDGRHSRTTYGSDSLHARGDKCDCLCTSSDSARCLCCGEVCDGLSNQIAPFRHRFCVLRHTRTSCLLVVMFSWIKPVCNLLQL